MQGRGAKEDAKLGTVAKLVTQHLHQKREILQELAKLEQLERKGKGEWRVSGC